MGETTRGTKRLGGGGGAGRGVGGGGETTRGKRPWRKSLGGETTRGGNGLGAKRLGFLVRDSRWLCTQNLYGNFRPRLTRHLHVNKRIISPDLMIFSQFHKHILKSQTNAIPKDFFYFCVIEKR